MSICWFNENRLGVVDQGVVLDVTSALQVLPPLAYPGAPGDHLVRHLEVVVPAIEGLLSRVAGYPVTEVRLASPVAAPGKIIGVPVNYLAHVEEAVANIATFTDRYTNIVSMTVEVA